MVATAPTPKDKRQITTWAEPFGRMFAPDSDQEAVMSSALDLFMEQANARRGSLMLIDPSDNRLRIARASGIPNDVMEQTRVPLGEGVAGNVAKTGQPVVIGRSTAHKTPVASRGTRYSSSSFASLPLRAGGRILGAMNVTDRPGDSEFDAEDVDVLQFLADQTALAIENARLRDQLMALTITDELTGLHNRRYFHSYLADEIARAKRYNSCFALALFDLDGFKELNDEHGHQAGDVMLKEFAQALKEHARRADVVARYGGDEFAVMFGEIGTDPANADVSFAERIRVEINQTQFSFIRHDEGQCLRVSVGIGVFPKHATTMDELLRWADSSLYRAKAEGGNRVCIRPQ